MDGILITDVNTLSALVVLRDQHCHTLGYGETKGDTATLGYRTQWSLQTADRSVFIVSTGCRIV